jgi:hypothetical protein
VTRPFAPASPSRWRSPSGPNTTASGSATAPDLSVVISTEGNREGAEGWPALHWGPLLERASDAFAPVDTLADDPGPSPPGSTSGRRAAA